MRPLIIGPDERAAISTLVGFAAEPENWFHPESGIVPGLNPAYAVHVPIGFRCVFTITQAEDKRFRHLSISVPDKGRYPSPEAAVMLAKEFGFTPPGAGLDLVDLVRNHHWIVDKMENCIVLAQAME
jgi:hypothetical protein